MDQTFVALGLSAELRRSWLVRAGFLLAFPVGMVAVALGEGIVEASLSLTPLQSALDVALLWGLWSVWHSAIFPRNRARYLAASRLPYRRAFIRDIVPGVVFGFSQMLRPLMHGQGLVDLLGLPLGVRLGHVQVWAGLLVAAMALTVFFHALNMLGVANAAFVPEFVRTEEFHPVESGVYRRARHPLFWSGILFSCGLALICGTTDGYLIAGVNVVYGLIYNGLEDRRLLRVFSSAYGDYAERVRARIPSPLQVLPNCGTLRGRIFYGQSLKPLTADHRVPLLRPLQR